MVNKPEQTLLLKHQRVPMHENEMYVNVYSFLTRKMMEMSAVQLARISPTSPWVCCVFT